MTPKRTAIIAAMIVSLGFLCVSQALVVLPNRPMSYRTDVFFQSDAGGLLQDAVEDRSFRARGTHPLLYPIWTWPLHRLAIRLEPTLARELTVTWVSRLGIATVAGLGFGLLIFALGSRGQHWFGCLALALLVVVVNGHAIAAIPDHFGLSTGLIAACFAVKLASGNERRKLLLFSLLAIAMFGVTITNVLLPLLLMSDILLRRHGHFLKRRIGVLCVIVIFVVAVAVALLVWNSPAIRARISERVEMYLNWRIVDQPVKAMEYTARGVIDCAVAPAPKSTLENLDHLPMLTYEPRESVFASWPYDPIQTIGAFAWLFLLLNGIRAAFLRREIRFVSVAISFWLVYNAAFHNLWGDEFFLYSPHSTGPLLLLAAFGFDRLPKWLLFVMVASIMTAALHTLLIFHSMINEITI